jgi:hypothetical protein
MKKSMVAMAVAMAVMSNVAAAQVTVSGEAVAEFESENGITNVNTTDTYVGITATEVLGSMNAMAVISLDVDTDAASTATARDAYVGLGTSYGTFKMGRMTNAAKDMSGKFTDIFASTNGLGLTNAGRIDDTIKVNVNAGSVALVGSTTHDGSVGNDKQDGYELGAGMDLGSFAAGALYSKNTVTGSITKSGLVGVALGDVNLAGSYEDLGSNQNTVNLVASMNVGNNVIKGGYKDSNYEADVYLAEIEHKFSSTTSAYVNGQHTAAGGTDAYTAGIKMAF